MRPIGVKASPPTLSGPHLCCEAIIWRGITCNQTAKVTVFNVLENGHLQETFKRSMVQVASSMGSMKTPVRRFNK